jgi:hypothetical protein
MVIGTQKMMSFGAVLSPPVIVNAPIYVGGTHGNIDAPIVGQGFLP